LMGGNDMAGTLAGSSEQTIQFQRTHGSLLTSFTSSYYPFVRMENLNKFEYFTARSS